jgi:glycerol-3-phosphate dehydrogenase (NAD(P)+)
VLAIATGISDGLGFGCNARAFLITRGLAEMNLLSVKQGADPLTLAGLAGVGDVILTCTSTLSRNYTVGYRLGKGEKLEDIVNTLGAVAEGVKTSKSAHALAESLGVETPVLSGIYRVIHLGESPLRVLKENMSRPLKEENILLSR